MHHTTFHNPEVDEHIQTIRRIIPEPALYEQLAEECVELAQASLKKARKLRDENFTPKTMDEIDQEIIEELTDVLLVANVCNLNYDKKLEEQKAQRWVYRNVE